MPDALAARRAAAFKNLPAHHRAQSLDDEEAPPPADGEQKGADKSVPVNNSAKKTLKLCQNRQSSNSRRRIPKKPRRKLRRQWKGLARLVPCFASEGLYL
jgi:hypothetical protein